jgi:hypothetical protein
MSSTISSIVSMEGQAVHCFFNLGHSAWHFRAVVMSSMVTSTFLSSMEEVRILAIAILRHILIECLDQAFIGGGGDWLEQPLQPTML